MPRDREKKKKRGKVIYLILLVILLAIILATMVAGSFIGKKVSLLNIIDIDIEDIAINDQLYNKISDKISLSEYNNIKTLVFFGVDTQGTGDGQDDEEFIGRSDSIVVVAINKEKKSLKLISVPRDTYAEIEGHEKNKINHAYAFGGPQLAIKTINQTFDLNLTDFITVDFAELVNIINEIGGIEINITKDEMNEINWACKSAYEISGNKRKTLTRYGTVTLDGEQALTHSRNRYVGDDFTRTGRQRQVLEAMMNKILKMDADKISETLDLLLKDVTTNINVADYMGLLSDFLLNKNTYMNNITSEQVPTREYAKDTFIDGIYYFVPNNPEDLKEKMIEYIYLK